MASVAASLARPAPRRRRRFLVGLLVAGTLGLLAGGCTDPCLALAQKLCDCQPTEIAKQSCLTNMLNAYDAARQSDLQKAGPECSKLVDKCDCHKLDTEAGKKACGLAR